MEALRIGLEEPNAYLKASDARDRIAWALEQYGENAVVLASMQKTSSVILHMLHELGATNEILFVDTGFHFHETLQARDELMRQYGLNLHTLYPELTPAQQEERYELKLYNYLDGQPDCCRMRKEEPFLKHMRDNDRKLVMLGLRSEEDDKRRNLRALEPDPRFAGHALHPLIDWSDDQVEAYIREHDVPVHALHRQNYPSIGCQVCTTPVTAGEDPRAGRWRHLRENGEGPKYCGLNFSDGGGI